jgi:hypothetical protein
MLGCFIMACFTVPGVLFLVSWGLRATSLLPPPGQRADRSSGNPARWKWATRETILVALAYAMWILRWWADPERSLHFAALAVPLAVAGLFQLAAAVQRSHGQISQE